jgi:hypothetical protein
MLFQSTYSNFVVLPADRDLDARGNLIKRIPGLSADFKGKGTVKTFDSVEAARQNRWTEEQRLEVERYLLSHAAFGRIRSVDGGGSIDRQVGNIQVYVLYLGPGQEIPPEHQEFVKDQPWYQIEMASGGRKPVVEQNEPTDSDMCAHREQAPDDPEEIISCNRKALKGKLYCRTHLEVPASA